MSKSSRDSFILQPGPIVRPQAGDTGRHEHATLRHTVTSVAATLLGALFVTATPTLAGPPAQEAFASPEAAVSALVTAAGADDTKSLVAILGPASKTLVSSGDPVADDLARERFVRSYEAAHSFEKSGDDRVTLQTGTDGWPFPIPLVKTDAGWRFDTEAGREEIINRRIGANELFAIQTCVAYGDAQREYQDRNPQGGKMPVYAQKFTSTPGKRDGLYWETKDDEQPSPLGPLFSRARGEGYPVGKGKPIPYHGYTYRILTAQGAKAPGGAYDYLVRGAMIGGFALVAYPAEWEASGVMTFVTNHDGGVFQKDLGPDTAKIALAMKSFDPDDTWKKVEVTAPDESPAPAAAASRRPSRHAAVGGWRAGGGNVR